MKDGYEIYVPDLSGVDGEELISVCIRETKTGTVIAKKEQTVIGEAEEKKKFLAPMLQHLMEENPSYFEEEIDMTMAHEEVSE